MQSQKIVISNTLGIDRNVDEIYQPKSIAELIGKIKFLLERNGNISVFSSGNNWGYGCSAPNRSGGLLIDLSACKQIRDFDSNHGIVPLFC